MKIKVIFCIALINTVIFTHAQNKFVCNYNTSIENTGCEPTKLAIDLDKEAKQAVDNILKPLGLPAHFILVECPDMENAIAITGSDGKRYILYDKKFMQAIANNSTEWAKISILAHEIGHHLSGHTLGEFDGLPNQRQQEIEADEFSGFILQKLGATLTQAQQAISLVSNNDDDTYKSHPTLRKRLLAIEKGYKNAKENLSNVIVATAKNTNSTEDFIYTGLAAAVEKDYAVAIMCYTKAIAIDPNSRRAYFGRANVKDEMGNHESAIEDYTKAIAIDPNDANSYHNRAYVKAALGDKDSAIEDYTRAIAIDPNKAISYYSRGAAKAALGNNESAIEDYTRAIAIDPNNAGIYYNRGGSRAAIGNYKGAIEDYTRAISIDPNDARAFCNRGNNKSAIGNHESAIEDYTRAIAIDPNSGLAYQNRGIAKYEIGNEAGALRDFKKACELNIEDGCNNYKIIKEN